MKKITPYLFLFTLFLASCTTNESIVKNDSEALLKSFKIVKDAQGRYSIDYDVNNDVTSELVKNIKTNSNEIYLFSEKGAEGESFSEALLLQNDFLKVGFVENNEKRKSIIIEDKDIVLAKGEESSEYLEEYSIEDLGNSEYELTFTVKDGVSTSFLYNEVDDIYEVHLQLGETVQKSFTRKYTKTAEALKIDFVNYLDTNISAKGEESYAERPRRPRAIIQE